LKTYIHAVSEKEILDLEKENPIPKLQSFKGTLDVPQASWQADLPDQLTLRSLSCYDCDLSEPCSHFTIGNLWKPLITKSKKNRKMRRMR